MSIFLVPQKKVETLYPEVAKATNLPLHVIEDVMKHQWESLTQFIENPTPYPVYRMMYLGRFILHRPLVYRAISKTISKYRTNPSYLTKLKALLRVRQPANEYYLFTKYKQRFGSWHFKPRSD